MKRERILNIVLAGMAAVLVFAVSQLESEIERLRTEPPAVEVRIDTVWVCDTILTPGPVVVREEVREVPAIVDTAEILQQYFTARVLADTFQLRDVATVRVTDTLFQNNIIGRAVDYDLAMLDISAEYKGPEKPSQARLALSLGVQLGSEQAAVIGGIRYKRVEVGVGYDLRLRAPSILLKYDLWQWR